MHCGEESNLVEKTGLISELSIPIVALRNGSQPGLPPNPTLRTLQLGRSDWA
jgi:hypothetical protein